MPICPSNAKSVNMLQCLLHGCILQIEIQPFVQTTTYTVKYSSVLLETKSYCKHHLFPVWWHVSLYGFTFNTFSSCLFVHALLQSNSSYAFLVEDKYSSFPLVTSLPLPAHSHLHCPFSSSCYNTALYFY